MTIGVDTERAATQYVEGTKKLQELAEQFEKIKAQITSLDGQVTKCRETLKGQVTPDNPAAVFTVSGRSVLILKHNEHTSVHIVDAYSVPTTAPKMTSRPPGTTSRPDEPGKGS